MIIGRARGLPGWLTHLNGALINLLLSVITNKATLWRAIGANATYNVVTQRRSAKGFTKIWVRRDLGLCIARPKFEQSNFCNSTIFSVH